MERKTHLHLVQFIMAHPLNMWNFIDVIKKEELIFQETILKLNSGDRKKRIKQLLLFKSASIYYVLDLKMMKSIENNILNDFPFLWLIKNKTFVC